jgi:hypothetical protein
LFLYGETNRDFPDSTSNWPKTVAHIGRVTAVQVLVRTLQDNLLGLFAGFASERPARRMSEFKTGQMKSIGRTTAI